MRAVTAPARTTLLALLATALATSALPQARLTPAQPIPPAELEAFVDGVTRQAMADGHIAGAAVSVVQNGQVVLSKGYGFASFSPYRPVDPARTLFRLGSISKTFTWILVLKQVEAGRMRLDAPINLYLPEYLRIPDDGFSEQIRVRDLMDHMPGFEDRALGQLFERDFSRVRPLPIYLREERPARVRPPATLVSYSNYGAALAGEAVSEVAGKPFETLVESEITGPLELRRTSFREPHPPRASLPAPLAPPLAGDLADGFHWTGTAFERRPFEYIEQIAPAGAASSTAADMARYMLALLGNGTLNGVSIYGSPTAVAFSTPSSRPAPGVPTTRHGLFESPLPGGFMGVGHGGATLSFYSNLVVVPSLDLGIFVTTNTDRGAYLARDLPSRVVERFYAPPPGAPPPGSRRLIEDRATFEGSYLVDRRAYHGLEAMVDRLIGEARVSVSPDGHLLVAGPGQPESFSAAAGPLSGRFVSDDGARALVFRMRRGEATGFFDPAGGSAFERIPLWRQTALLATMTLLTCVVALATLRGVLIRRPRDFRESSSQRRAGLIIQTQSALWLVSVGLFGVWALRAGDVARVMYDWPGVMLVGASASALVASLLSLPTLLLIPSIWRGGRRLDSWGAARKARYSLLALEFTAFAVLLASWGALEPWST